MERLNAHRRKIIGEMLNPRFMADGRMRKVGTRPWLGRVFAASSVNVIQLLGLGIKRLELVVRDRPAGEMPS